MSVDDMAGRRTCSVLLVPVRQHDDLHWGIGMMDSDALDATLTWDGTERSWILRADLPLNDERTARWEVRPSPDDHPRSVPDHIWMEVLATLLAWAARQAYDHRGRLIDIADKAEIARDHLRDIVQLDPAWEMKARSA